MAKTIHDIGGRRLAHELDLSFSTIKQCVKGNSDFKIPSKVIVPSVYRPTDRQIDMFIKTVFSDSEDLKKLRIGGN